MVIKLDVITGNFFDQMFMKLIFKEAPLFYRPREVKYIND